MVLDYISAYKVVQIFPNTKRLLSLCYNARQKYQTNWDFPKLEKENLQKKKKTEDENTQRLNELQGSSANKLKQLWEIRNVTGVKLNLTAGHLFSSMKNTFLWKKVILIWFWFF